MARYIDESGIVRNTDPEFPNIDWCSEDNGDHVRIVGAYLGLDEYHEPLQLRISHAAALALLVELTNRLVLKEE